jgi:1,4-dihydroxy-2-naphthoate octaprenyltransferase
MANNIRDLERDRRAGVKTLATVIGARAAKLLYFTFLSAAYAIEVAFSVLHVLPLWSLLSLASAPLLMGIAKKALREPSWKGMDVATANLATMFGLLEAVGLLVAVLA